MKVLVSVLAILILAVIPAGWYYTKKSQREKSKVLSQQVVSLPPEPTPTSEPSPSPKPSPQPSPSPTPTPLPPTFTHQQINEFINGFASQYNVSPDILRHIALCESGFKQSAINGPYTGLYQFSANTWKSHRIKMGKAVDANLRLNAQEAVETAAYVLQINNAGIWPNCVP